MRIWTLVPAMGWAFWGPAEVRTPTQIDTTNLRAQGHRGRYPSFVTACTRRFHCAVDFATVGSLSKGNEPGSHNRLRSQGGIQALFGSMFGCLKHAVGRSPHSRWAGQSAERSDHSPATPQQTPMLASRPGGPCWRPLPPRSNATTEPRDALHVAAPACRIRSNVEGSNRRPKTPFNIRSQHASSSRPGYHIPRRSF